MANILVMKYNMNMCIMINSVIAFGSAKYGLYFTYEFSKHRK